MLTVVLESLDGVDPAVAEHYKERDGKFQLDLSGAFSTIDRDKLQEGLRKEREDHGATKLTLRGFGEFTPEKITTLGNEHTQLTADLAAARSQGGPTAEEIDAQVEARLVSRINPVQRELDALKVSNGELTSANETLTGDANRGNISRSVLAAFGNKDLGTNQDAVEDVQLWAERVFEIDADGKVVSKDGVGVTPGLDPASVFSDMRMNGLRKHWFGSTTGANATGGKDGVADSGDNPFTLVGEGSAARPKNFTGAAQMIKSDPAKAKRLATAAKAQVFFPILFNK